MLFVEELPGLEAVVELAEGFLVRYNAPGADAEVDFGGRYGSIWPSSR
ncbi:hypothetical protein ACIP79_27535 [Streptomyces sp. NPDC088747]